MLGVKFQAPEPLATAVPATVPSNDTVTVMLASAVPEMKGVAVLTNAPFAGVATTGAAGATVSTVNHRALETELVLPAASVTWAVTTCAPCERAVPGVKFQAPEPLATAVPAAVPSKKIVTVLSASAVPETTGVEVFTTAPLEGVTNRGALGATVSTVKERALEMGLALPAASVAWAVTA